MLRQSRTATKYQSLRRCSGRTNSWIYVAQTCNEVEAIKSLERRPVSSKVASISACTTPWFEM
jgi:hypothetical protein